MSGKIAICLPLSFLCGALVLAQNWQPTERIATEKNSTEHYAAYLLQTTYYQQGYVAAKVEIKQDGPKRLFILDPGELFHLNDVVVTGLQNFPANQLMQNGPKSGDVFSPIRITDWEEQVRNNYAKSIESVHGALQFDYAHHQVNVQLTVKERN